MKKDDGMSSNEKREMEQMEQLEAEIQALLQSPVPMEPDFKARLRAELLREHRRLYGKQKIRRRWPLGILSGTAAAALVLVMAGQMWPGGEPPLNQAEGEKGGKSFVWDHENPSPLSPQPTTPSPADDDPASEASEAATALKGGSPADEPATEPAAEPGMAARSDGDGNTGDGREEVERQAGREEAVAGEQPDGPAVALGPANGGATAEEKPSAGSSSAGAGAAATQPVREFVFSSSYITMSDVEPFRADTLPAHVELKVDESALPAEKPVYSFDDSLLPEKQQRQAIAQVLGLGQDEQVTAKGFRYRGADGSTLLFSVEGLPAMEYVYRGELDGQAGNRSAAKQAQAFLKRIGIDVTGMNVQVETPSGEGDKRIVTFIPELAGAPNLAEAVTVHVQQGTVVEAKVPLLDHVQTKQRAVPLVPLSEALQRVVFAEEYFIHPDEKVVIDEAELVYYAFEDGTLAPAYQLRGVEEKSGKLIQMIVSAVTADDAGN